MSKCQQFARRGKQQMRLCRLALQGLAARRDLVIRTLQLERDPPAGNGRIFQPRRDLQAEYLELSLEIGKCAKISMVVSLDMLLQSFRLLPDGRLSRWRDLGFAACQEWR